MAANKMKTVWYALGSMLGADATGFKTGADYVYSYDGTSTFTDYTTAAGNGTANDVVLTNATDAALYIGCTDGTVFDQVHIYMGTVSSSSGARQIEYYNGAAWVSLTVTNDAGTDELAAQRNNLSFTPPADWANVTVNSQSGRYVRIRQTGAITTVGICDKISVGRQHSFAKAIYIPETTSRAFKSVGVIVGSDIYHGGTLISANAPLFSQRYTHTVNGSTVAIKRFGNSVTSGSAEHYRNEVVVDVTSSFTAGYTSGTSQTLTFTMSQCIETGASDSATYYGNIYAYVFITYEFDSSAHDTLLKTVFIPIESNLASSLVQSGGTTIKTNGVPALSTFLPEKSPSNAAIAAGDIKDSFFVVETARTPGTGTTDQAFDLALGAEAYTNIINVDNALSSGIVDKMVWVKTPTDVTQAYDFKARTTTNNYYGSVCAVMFVTYEYSWANSTNVMTSVLLPFTAQELPSSASGGIDNTFVPYWVPEASPTLKQSALLAWTPEFGSTCTINVGMGSQTARAYTLMQTSNDVPIGPMPVVHQFDSGSAAGAGHTLVAGLNHFQLNFATSASNAGGHPFGWVLLNYSFTKPSSIEAHNKTIWGVISDTYSGNVRIAITGWKPIIMEADYWINGAAYTINTNFGGDFGGQGVLGELTPLTGEGKSTTDAYMGMFHQWGRSRQETNMVQLVLPLIREDAQIIGRFPGMAKGVRNPALADLSTTPGSRECILNRNPTNNSWAMAGWCGVLTYHTMTTAVAGTVSAYADADGAGLTVDLYAIIDKSGKYQYVRSATTSAGGSYTMNWYDPASVVFTVVHEDSTHMGVSQKAAP